MTYVFLDTETTGLDPDRHEVWEIAFAVDDGPVKSQIVTHDLRCANSDALQIGGHTDRCDAFSHPTDDYWGFEVDLQDNLRGATLVGANPAFDAGFLRVRWQDAPWRYRLLDVEAYAMPALGLTEPKGLAYIAAQLGIDQPDHTAAQDVHVLRECWRALRRIYGDTPLWCPTAPLSDEQAPAAPTDAPPEAPEVSEAPTEVRECGIDCGCTSDGQCAFVETEHGWVPKSWGGA